MSQTILIDDNENRKKMYSLNLNIFVGTDVVLKNNHHEAITLLKVHPSVDLIVCQSTIGNEKAAEEIQQFLNQESRKIPLIILGKDTAATPIGKYYVDMEEPTGIKNLVGQVAKILGVRAQDLVDRPVPELYPVPITFFISLEQTKCDIFLRLKRTSQEDRFIKRFRAEENLSQGAISRYIGYGETHLYIPSADRIKFTNNYTQQMKGILQNENLGLDERVRATEDSMKFVAQEVNDLVAIDDEIRQLTQASIQSLARTVRDSPTLESMLKNLLSNKSGFLFQHCQVTTFVGRHLIKALGWWTPELMEKMGTVAFFHDILLTTPQLAMITNQVELQNAPLSSDERTLVSKHPYLAADLIKKFSNIPADMENIVRQHHGSYGGIGFVDKFPTNIAPMAMVFVVAEDFTHRLLKCHFNQDGLPAIMGKFSKEDALHEMREKFAHPKYVEIIDTLKTLAV